MAKKNKKSVTIPKDKKNTGTVTVTLNHLDAGTLFEFALYGLAQKKQNSEGNPVALVGCKQYAAKFESMAKQIDKAYPARTH